ncbi:MAG: hypothetical protein LUF00_07730 [Lachnospiraceae bacterium]|nr:hypothetical protein [Lachnospiraceae bacterium]
MLRVIIDLTLIAPSIFLMILQAGSFMAIPDLIALIVFSNNMDMEVLADLWGWEEKSVMSLLPLGFRSILFLLFTDFGFLANIIGGLIGIVARILTMGIFSVPGILPGSIRTLDLNALGSTATHQNGCMLRTAGNFKKASHYCRPEYQASRPQLEL